MTTDEHHATERAASVVTLGTYDGVHLGHQYLIDQAVEAGRALSLPAVIVTFDRLPAEVLRPAATPKLLTGLEHKLELLGARWADEVVVLHFDEARAKEEAEHFVTEYLVGALGTRALYLGASFRFGRGARGDIGLLHDLAASLGFSVHGVELVMDEETNTAISSTRIRNLVGSGELQEAARLLGRPHELRGTLLPDAGGIVVHGGFALPPAGTYEVTVGPPGGPGSRSVASVPGGDGPSAEVLIAFDTASDALEGARPGEAIAIRFS